MATGLVWIKPPSTLVNPLQDYQEKLLTAVYSVAAYVGQKMQDEARTRAEWSDWTNNARSGLFFAVDGFGLAPLVGVVNVDDPDPTRGDSAIISGTSDRLVLALSHTMYYGKYLELSNGGRYAIIVSTMERNMPQLERMLKQAFR
ncbi:hypothetical protein TFLX_03141 [Thermoflexales bacterium]|nr:hypothetical protein TFLX_03141 [Thermoflexales bacterium]